MTEYNLSDWNLQDLSIIMHLPYTYRISRINISSVIGCALLSPFCSNFVLGRHGCGGANPSYFERSPLVADSSAKASSA